MFDTDAVLIVVRDGGTGIAEENLTRLFDPFFTTKEEGKGRGLGLAVAYAIVQDHGGKIVARNREGGGAEVTVTLPALPARPATVARAARAPPQIASLRQAREAATVAVGVEGLLTARGRPPEELAERRGDERRDAEA